MIIYLIDKIKINPKKLLVIKVIDSIKKILNVLIKIMLIEINSL
jgi:hypothetical protein